MMTFLDWWDGNGEQIRGSLRHFAREVFEAGIRSQQHEIEWLRARETERKAVIDEALTSEIVSLVYTCERCKRDIRPYDACLEQPQPCRCCLASEIERLQANVLETRNAVRLCIGNQIGVPWPEISDAAVDGYITFVREAAEAKGGES